MTAHRWWSASLLEATRDVIAPINLAEILRNARLW